jgi:site-specific recombinase XerC
MIAEAKRGAPLPATEDVRQRLGLGHDADDPGVTVSEHLTAWLAGKQRARRASTVRMYESHNRIYISPKIGDLPLEKLNTRHIEQVLAGVPGSAATRHRVLATLRAALNAAIRQRLILWNPAAGIELEPENPPEAKRWTPAEAARFIDFTAGDPLGLAYRIMILRGVRRTEFAGFRWAGVDLDRGVMTVARPIVQLGGKLHKEARAKTRAGDRLVFLDGETAGLLREHRKAQLAARMRSGPGYQDNDLVFAREDGTPWNPDHISKRFKRLAAQAGLPVVKLHDGGRHTGVSLMHDAEIRDDIAMREAEHADRAVHQRYNHILTEAHLAAAEQVAELARKAGNGS